MKHILLLSFLFSALTPVIGQQVILKEDFSGKNNHWVIQTSGNDIAEIREGKLVLQGYGDNTFNAPVHVKLNASNDFSVSVTATHLSGVDNYAYGIAISNAAGDQYYNFVISAIGFYKFTGFEEGKHRQFIDWTAHASLNKSNADNTITLAKDGSNIKLFVNKTLAATIPNINLPSELTVALTRSNKQSVAFDDLEIKN